MKAIPALALAGRAVLLFLLALAAGIPPARAADANPPDRLTYQGFLVDANGTALGNTAPKNYDVIFRIWKNSSSALVTDRLWTEQQTLTVDKGYFSVLLGEGAAVGSEARPALSTLFAAADASDRYVEITVKGIGAGGTDSTIAPRLRLLTAPYAFLAKSASQLVNSVGSPYVSASGTTVSVAGTISAASFTGSGASLTNLTAAQIPSLDAAKITSGTFSAASMIPNLDASKITTGTFNSARIPSLDASTITTGTFDVERMRLNDKSLYLRAASDANLGLGFFGTANIYATNKTFASVNVDGPVLYGYGGGALGTRQGTTEKIALQWTPTGNVTFGGTISGNGSGLTGLTASQIPNLDPSQINAGTLNASQVYGSSGLRLTSGSTSYSIPFYFGTAKSFQVQSDGVYVYKNDENSKYVAWTRTGSGFYFYVAGATTQSTTDRTVSYDGDSNWDFSSDRRLKTNIVDAESVLERVMAVKMRRFRWIGGNPEAAPELGVIAQEFQPLFPELVSKTTPATPNPACPDGVMTVGLTSLGTIAIKAIQELKQEKDGEIAGLKQENTLLKEKIEQLSRQAAHVAQLEQEMATLKKLVARAVELRRDERPVAGTPVTSSSGTGGN